LAEATHSRSAGTLIKQLGRASSADIKAVLATREKIEPETDLRADVVARVEEQIQAGMNQLDQR